MNSTAIISVDYTERQPATYRGILLSLNTRDGDGRRFYTGNPSRDYKVALAWAESRSMNVMRSATIENYIMDGGLDILEEA